MELRTSVLTTNGLSTVDNVEDTTTVLVWNEKKLLFCEVKKSSCKPTPSSRMVRFVTRSGNVFVVSHNQQFVIWTDGASEIIPAYLLNVGSKLFAAGRNGKLVEDMVTEIGPAFGGSYVDCRLHCPDPYHPVFFAGGLGIISY